MLRAGAIWFHLIKPETNCPAARMRRRPFAILSSWPLSPRLEPFCVCLGCCEVARNDLICVKNWWCTMYILNSWPVQLQPPPEFAEAVMETWVISWVTRVPPHFGIWQRRFVWITKWHCFSCLAVCCHYNGCLPTHCIGTQLVYVFVRAVLTKDTDLWRLLDLCLSLPTKESYDYVT